jgi:hypothetical protein
MASFQTGKAGQWIRVFSLLALLAAVLMAGSTSAWAQIDQGGISGSVKDQEGALVPNAAVTIISKDTGLQFHTKTDSAGEYAFQPLKVGLYKVQATAKGFDTYTTDNVQVDANQTAKADLSLKLGSASDYVVVNAEEKPVLQTEDASVGDTFTSKEVNELPIPNRDYVFLAQLSPGVVADQNNSAAGAFSANGMRSQQNNFLLDGVDNNSTAFDNMSGANYVILTTPEAVNQVRVQTGNYSAELGRSGGAVVNVVSKSGTRRLQGEAWGYFRNQVFDATPDFTTTKNPYHDEDMGLALGGPITQKLFFFGDTRQWRIYSAVPALYTVPTALARTGNFSEYANPALANGNTYSLYEPPNPNQGLPGWPTEQMNCNGVPDVLCQSQIDPVASTLVNLLPLPNVASQQLGQPNYNTTILHTYNTNSDSIRFDWNLSSKDQAYFRYAYTRNNSYAMNPFGPILGGGNVLNILGMGFVLSETHIFSARLLNEFRLGFTYGSSQAFGLNNLPQADSQLGLGGISSLQGDPGGIPQFAVSGISTFGSIKNSPQYEGQNSPQLLDNVSYVLRNHSLRFGVSIQQVRAYELHDTWGRGLYTYTGKYTSYKGASSGVGLADFLTGNMYSANRSIGINNTIPAGHDERWSNAAYAQDDWRATSSLTINLGLRWDYFSPYTEHNSHQANFSQLSPSAPNIIYGSGYGVYLFPRSLSNIPIANLLGPYAATFAKDNIAVGFSDNDSGTKAQHLNFSPRVGFAYQMGQNTVIRGAYGLFFGGLESVGFAGNLAQNYPFDQELSYTAPSCTVTSCPNAGIALPTGFQGTTSVPQLILRSAPQHIKTTQAQIYNLTVERDILHKLIWQVGYVGTVGRHLQVFGPDTNTPAALYPNTGYSYLNWVTFPDFGQGLTTSNIGISSYNSLQSVMALRPTAGLSFTASYTYSHSLDDAIQSQEVDSSVFYYRGPDIFGIRPDYSNSTFDTRHRLTFRGTYELPFGNGRHFMNHKGWTDVAFGRWNVSPILRVQTGNPFSVSGNNVSVYGGQAHAVLVGDPTKPGGTPDPSNTLLTGCPTQVRNKTNWYNPCAYANPAPASSVPAPAKGQPLVNGTNYVMGAAAIPYLGGRLYSTYGPGYFSLDSSLAKTFTLTTRYTLQFRWDVYNATNTPALGNPSDKSIDQTAGQITSARGGAQYAPGGRYMQLAVRFMF